MKTNIKHTERAENLYERVLNELINGEYLPGGRIFEKDLAEKLNVSRIPLREVLSKLIGQGIMCSSGQYHGIWLRQYNIAEICELYELRSILESGAAYLAAKKSDSIGIFQLKIIFDKMEETMDAGNFASPEWSSQDCEFHYTMVSMSKNKRLIESVKTLLLERHFLFYQNPQRRQLIAQKDPIMMQHAIRVRNSHHQIFASIQAREPDGAAAAVRQHFEEASEAMIYSVKKTKLFNSQEVMSQLACSV